MRCVRLMISAVVAVASIAATAPAQPPDPMRARGDTVGIFAGLAWSPVSLEFGGASSERQNAVAIHLGYRFLPFGWLCKGKSGVCGVIAPLRLTPQLGYGATHVLGLKAPGDAYAFSFIDLPGLVTTYPLGDAVLLSLIVRSGKHTAERFQDGDVVNYWGSGGGTLGVALEFPLVASGRGIEVALLRMRGTFDSVESRNEDRSDKVILPANVSYRVLMLQVGWSGPFTGISLPWQ
jgi:hypothetical protein